MPKEYKSAFELKEIIRQRLGIEVVVNKSEVLGWTAKAITTVRVGMAETQDELEQFLPELRAKYDLKK